MDNVDKLTESHNELFR